MLRFLRNSIKSFLVKALITVLLLTFVLWGVGDIIRGSKQDYALKINGTKISKAEFIEAFQMNVAMIEEQLGQQFEQSQIADPYFKRYVVNQIITQNLLKILGEEMELLISDDMVKYQIASMSAFHKDGKFNIALFDDYIKQIGITEAKFISLIKKEMLLNNISTIFNMLRPSSSLLTNTLLKARGQTRVINLINISPSLVSITEYPSESTLRDLYNTKQEAFSVDERRDLSYAILSTDNIKDKITVSEDEIKKRYEPQNFTIPQKRIVSQVIFKEKEQAEAAYKEMEDGKNFQEVARKYFPKNKSFLLGEVTAQNFSTDIASVIFDLPLQGHSKVIGTPLGFHIFNIDSIIEERKLKYEEVKDKIEATILNEKKHDILNTLATKIDKEILSNKSLEDVNSSLNLKIQQLSKVSYEHVTEMMKYDSFKKAAFSLTEGSTSSVTPYDNGNKYFIVKVNKIYPKTFKDFKEVKTELTKAWIENQTNIKLHNIADDVYKALSSGENMKSVINKFNLPQPRLLNISYFSEIAKKLPYKFVKDVFMAKQGDYLPPYTLSVYNKGFNIAFVDKIIDADLNQISNKNNEVKEELQENTSQELLWQLLSYARNKFEIDVNKEFIDQFGE